MADAQLQIVIDALNKASDELTKLKTDLGKVDDQSKKTEESTGKLGTGISDIKGKALIAATAITGVYLAAKQVYEIASEGADLLYMEDRFDNLTASIGTTSDALMKDLREATGGLKSDVELMSGATDMLSLGLAGTHDEAVRLSTVAGALDMNMQQLTLTLTNETTARFDSLNVSTAGFNERLQELKDSGMDASKAFKEAFLQQAEQQIERVGKASDSAVASFARFEAQVENTSNNIKKSIATILAPAFDDLADKLEDGTNFATAMTDALESGAITQQEYNDVQKAVRRGTMDISEATEWATEKIDEHAIATEGARRATDPYSDSLEYAAQAAEYLAKKEQDAALAAEEMTKKNEAFMSLTEDLSGVFADYSSELSDIAVDIGEVTDELGELYAQQHLTTEQKEQVAELEGKYGELVTQIQEVAAAHREATNAMIFDLMTQKLSADGLDDAEFAVLMNIGEDLGVIEEGAGTAAIELDKMLNGVLEDGVATEDEMALIKDHIATFSETAPGAQQAMDAVLHQVRADGEVTSDELATIEETLGALYSSADDRKAKMDEILTQFAEEADKGLLDVTGIEETLGRLDGKTFETELIVNITEVGGTVPSNGQAAGGPVSAGNPYLWQEYGYRGEVFVPSQNGFVLSRADAKRILQEAGKGGNTYNYSLTMPTSANPSDVIMAFELMQAYGGN